jgi:DNA helicase-2/ATP-dependent DNA helicase PcrA
VTEERRLAYVAFTRARRDLFLAGSWWRDGARATPPSPFLTELADAGLVTIDGWAERPGEEEKNPRTAEPVEVTWPLAGISAARESLRCAAEHVRARPNSVLPGPGELIASDGVDLGELTRVLLAERSATGRADAELDLPAHLSASSLIRLAGDRDEFARHLRRPVPSRPSADANRGTRFHLWAERYFTTASLLDPFDLPGEDDDLPGEQDLEALQEAFRTSEWAGRTPIAVEADVETPIGGIMIRSRIDAVFPELPELGGPGAVVVVDWKTGRAPTDARARRHREVQLAVYRLAWSRWAGIPLGDVHAAFFYVASGTTVRPERLLGVEEIEALLRGDQ